MADDTLFGGAAAPEGYQQPRRFGGLSLAEWMAVIGGALQGVTLGGGPYGGGVRPFAALPVVAQVLEGRQQQGQQFAITNDLLKSLPDDDPRKAMLTRLSATGQLTPAQLLSEVRSSEEGAARRALAKAETPRSSTVEVAPAQVFGNDPEGTRVTPAETIEGPPTLTKSDLSGRIAQLPERLRENVLALPEYQRAYAGAPAEAPTAAMTRQYAARVRYYTARGLLPERARATALAEVVGGVKGAEQSTLDQSVWQELRQKYDLTKPEQALAAEEEANQRGAPAVATQIRQQSTERRTVLSEQEKQQAITKAIPALDAMYQKGEITASDYQTAVSAIETSPKSAPQQMSQLRAIAERRREFDVRAQIAMANLDRLRAVQAELSRARDQAQRARLDQHRTALMGQIRQQMRDLQTRAMTEPDLLRRQALLLEANKLEQTWEQIEGAAAAGATQPPASSAAPPVSPPSSGGPRGQTAPGGIDLRGQGFLR